MDCAARPVTGLPDCPVTFPRRNVHACGLVASAADTTGDSDGYVESRDSPSNSLRSMSPFETAKMRSGISGLNFGPSVSIMMEPNHSANDSPERFLELESCRTTGVKVRVQLMYITTL